MAPDSPTLEPVSTSEQHNQLRFILDVSLRHWVMLTIFTVLSTVAGGVIGKLLQEEWFEYEAIADLLVNQSPWEQPAMRGLGGNVFGVVTPKALVERTSKRGLAEDVARTLVQEDLANGGPLGSITSDEEYSSKALEIENVLSFEPLAESGILRIRARSDNREDASRIAEYAARSIIDYTRQHQLDEHEEAYALVQEQLEDIRKQLDDAETLQWSFREDMGFQTHAQLWAQMEKKDTELTETNSALEEAQSRLREIDGALAKNSEVLPEALGNVSEKTVTKLITELEVLLGEKVELLVDWLPGSPGLAPIEDDIEAKRRAVQLAIGELSSGIGGGSRFWAQRQDLYRQKLALELELTTLDLRGATIKAVLIEMVERLPSLTDQSLDYEQLSHEAEQIRRQFDRMLEKEFEIKTALTRGSATVERREAVVVIPTFSDSGSPVWASGLLGALIGFIVGFALAMMIEMMDTSIHGIEDVSEHIGLEVLGMIPMMKFGKARSRGRRKGAFVVTSDEEQVDACIVTQHDPKSPISEAYRSLRTNFQFATLQNKPKAVMITSAVPGEGKTTTAINFAVTMADRGMRILVVDTDLRRPNVHRVLKMERGPGLADVLRERIPVQSVIRPTRVENLWIISSGRVPPNPSELIGSERMKGLMADLRQGFDLVVCDAPSVLVVTDPVLLATHVDTVVLVISVNNARRETIQRAKTILGTANPSIAGVVLNGLEATRRHYYYYYYYYDDAASMARRRWYHNL